MPAFKTWEDAHAEAIKRAIKYKHDYLLMKNAFGEFSIAMTGDTSDYYKYEIIRWKDWARIESDEHTQAMKDAETASMEELEAAEAILERAKR